MLFSYYFDFSDIASVDENTAVALNPDSSGFLRVNDSEKFVPHGFSEKSWFFRRGGIGVAPNPDLSGFLREDDSDDKGTAFSCNDSRSIRGKM